MLDGLYKDSIDRVWEAVARLLVRAGLYPNQVTWAGMGLVAVACALYAWHREPLWFGLMLALAFSFDALDGAVARLRDCATRYGGYLDAVLDRYQEILVLGTIAAVDGFWGAAFLAVTGSLLVSYNKARVAVEMPIDNTAWPDLLERLERLLVIIAALLLDGWVTLPPPLPERLLETVLLVLGVLAHATAIQRFARGSRLLDGHDR